MRGGDGVSFQEIEEDLKRWKQLTELTSDIYRRGMYLTGGALC